MRKELFIATLFITSCTTPEAAPNPTRVINIKPVSRQEEIIRGVPKPPPTRIIRPTIESQPPVEDKRILGYQQILDFEAGVIVNEHPNMLIEVSRTKLNYLYSDVNLGMRLPNDHKHYFIFFQGSNRTDLMNQFEIFKATRMIPIADSLYSGRRLILVPTGIGVEELLEIEKERNPNKDKVQLLDGISHELSLQWHSALINYPKTQEVKRIAPLNGVKVLNNSPFNVLSLDI